MTSPTTSGLANGRTPNAATALGLHSHVYVEFPCEACDCTFDEHDATGKCTAIIDVPYTREQRDDAADKKRLDPDYPPLPLRTKPCECLGFDGLLEDGTVRALRCRMPSNFEWSTLQLGSSLPVQTGQGQGVPDAPVPAKVLRRMDWSRRLIQISITHARVSGGKWQPIRIVATEADVTTDWDLSLDTLDRGGSSIVEAVVLALVADYNDGGPFGGQVRRFRKAGARDVSQALERVSVQDAARTDVQPTGRAGGVDSPVQPGG